VLRVARHPFAGRWVTPLLGLALGCGGATAQGGPPSEPLFVAVGAEGAILSSRDARGWSLEDSGITKTLNSVAASDRSFVVVGEGGTILSSANARSWTARRSGTERDLEQVTFDGVEFVAVGGGWSDQAVALTSLDGVSWKRLEAPPQYSFQAVATARGTIFAAAVTPSRELPMALDHVVLASVLPSTSNRGGWISRDLPSFSDGLTLESEGDSETFLVGSWNGESTISRSRDGERWQSEALSLPDARAVAAGPGRFVVLGGSAALVSTDGDDWSETSLPVRRGSWLTAVTHGAATFASVGLDGTIFSSTDGGDWSAESSGVTSDLFDITFGPGP
jgi:hypothetical protein